VPKKKPPKLKVESTTDSDVIHQVVHSGSYGSVACEGFQDKAGTFWVSKRSHAAAKRRQELDREKQLSRDSTKSDL
jgi:hypothetical protein